MSDSYSVPTVPIIQRIGGFNIYHDEGESHKCAAGPSTLFESPVIDTADVPSSQSALDSTPGLGFNNPMIGDFARTFDFLEDIRKSLADKGAAPNRNIQPYELAQVMRIVSGGIIDLPARNCLPGLRKYFASAITFYF